MGVLFGKPMYLILSLGLRVGINDGMGWDGMKRMNICICSTRTRTHTFQTLHINMFDRPQHIRCLHVQFRYANT